MWTRTVSLVNGRVVTDRGLASTIRFDSIVRDLDRPSHPRDLVVDLDGAFVVPGLVNAHDHLELNHFGAVKFRDRYTNAADWIDDVRPRLDRVPALCAGRRHRLADRLFIGGLKNVLAGVTTVAHHNPHYPELRRSFPVHVVRNYGWAHSFHLEGGAAGANGEPAGSVGERFRSTPAGAPFLVHLAEGTDERARGELGRLDRLGALDENTIVVHGVALGTEGWKRLVQRRAGLVWCPASNLFLFGETAPIDSYVSVAPTSTARLALGSDSRLTGSRDLLDELRVAARLTTALSNEDLLSMVTDRAAALLRLRHAGRLTVGAPADLVVVPPLATTAAAALLAASRGDLSLVVRGGRPVVGNRRYLPVFDARRVAADEAWLDGRAKLLDESLARRLEGCAIAEPGIEIAGRRAVAGWAGVARVTWRRMRAQPASRGPLLRERP